jgi:two-component system, OmpR family, sensor histidine kinase CiaH
MLVLTLILATLGTVIYAALEQTLLDQVDRTLASRAEQAGPVFDSMARGLPPGGPPGREGYRGGVFYLLLDPGGNVIANPQQVDPQGLEFPEIIRPAGVFRTVSVNGEATRQYIRPLGPRAPMGARLVVGQSLAGEETAMRSLLAVLIAGGAIGIILSFLGAWFLAGRALVPIEHAFRRQREFVADASHELRTPLTVLRSATDLLHRQRTVGQETDNELRDEPAGGGRAGGRGRGRGGG